MILGICLITLPSAGLLGSYGCGGSGAGATDDDDDNNDDGGPPEGSDTDPGEIASLLAGTYDIVTTRSDGSTDTAVIIFSLNEDGELTADYSGGEESEEESDEDEEPLSFTGWVLENEFSITASFTDEMPDVDCALTSVTTIAGQLEGDTLTCTQTRVMTADPEGCASDAEGEIMFEEGETTASITGTRR